MTAGHRRPDEEFAVGGTDTLAEPLRSLPAGPTKESLLAELAEVRVAQEELRVAEEEMRVQQEQITQLLLRHDAERRWRGQLTALVPVGLCVTDGTGALVEANPALATHLGTALQRLHGKPLSVYLAPGDVREFRSALRVLRSGTASEHRLAVMLRPRRLDPVPAHLFGFTETAARDASAARITWVVVPEDGAGDLDLIDPAAARPRPRAADGEPMPASAVIGLATSLAELSALPVDDMDRQRLLGRMATLLRGAVPDADWVSITMGNPMEPQRLGSDSAEAQDFDGRQVRAGEGPCWQAYDTGAVVVSDDVTTDPRWPALAAIAGEGAVRSVLAVPVLEDGAATGAVNVYSGRTQGFGAAGRRIAELATAAVAGVLRTVAERESMQTLAQNLERALTSRAVIDQAKGVVMARLDVDADEAFARLVKVSSRLNVKVRDLAALIVEGHVDAVLRAGG
ncbi:ANTAR domain-containing protein [Geodermatophilus sp. SYSU D00815]